MFQNHIQQLGHQLENERQKPARRRQQKEGKGIGKYLIKGLASVMYKPKGWKAPQINVPYPSEMPPKTIIIQMVNAAYEPAAKAATNIDGWELIKSTDTLKFYKKGEEIIVAIRGTADGSDVSADAQLAIRGVRPTARFQKDVKTMNEVKAQYPNATYYGCGHSLGGAVLDAFIKSGDIVKGVSYNPAVEKSELGSTKNYRIYMDNDPLYNTMGQYSRLGEVRKQPPVSRLDSVATAQSLKSHLLSNFVGGRRLGMEGGDFNDFLRNAIGVAPIHSTQLKNLQESDLIDPADIEKVYDPKEFEDPNKLKQYEMALQKGDTFVQLLPVQLDSNSSGNYRGGFGPLDALGPSISITKALMDKFEPDQSITKEEYEKEYNKQFRKRIADLRAEAYKPYAAKRAENMKLLPEYEKNVNLLTQLQQSLSTARGMDQININTQIKNLQRKIDAVPANVKAQLDPIVASRQPKTQAYKDAEALRQKNAAITAAYKANPQTEAQRIATTIANNPSVAQKNNMYNAGIDDMVSELKDRYGDNWRSHMGKQDSSSAYFKSKYGGKMRGGKDPKMEETPEDPQIGEIRTRLGDRLAEYMHQLARDLYYDSPIELSIPEIIENVFKAIRNPLIREEENLGSLEGLSHPEIREHLNTIRESIIQQLSDIQEEEENEDMLAAVENDGHRNINQPDNPYGYM